MKSLLVIGNGPSAKTLDFSKIAIDTFCLNNSYKMFPKLNFYPTYFGSFDTRHCKENKYAYMDLIRNSQIKKFFIPPSKMEEYPNEIKNHKKMIKDFVFKKIKRVSQFEYPKSFQIYRDGGNSGVNAVLCAYLLGYTNIFLIGCDSSYANNVVQADHTPKDALKIINSNYWIENYYSNESDIQFAPSLRFHHPFWKALIKKKPKKLNLYNCSEIASFKIHYPFKAINEVYKKI